MYVPDSKFQDRGCALFWPWTFSKPHVVVVSLKLPPSEIKLGGSDL